MIMMAAKGMLAGQMTASTGVGRLASSVGLADQMTASCGNGRLASTARLAWRLHIWLLLGIGAFYSTIAASYSC